MTFRNASWYNRGVIPEPSASGEITVTEREVLIRGPVALAAQGGATTHVMLDRQESNGRLALATKPPRLQNYPVPPAMTSMGTLALADANPVGWVLHEPKGGYYLSTVQDNPDLYDVKRRVGPTVLGDVVYFGAWAADIRTRRILWRLPVTRLRFPAVPIDGGVIIVDDLDRLRAFRSRKSRS